MAIQAVGLKTHIWNNNLKSVAILIFYPLILTPFYMLLVAFILTVLQYEFEGDPMRYKQALRYAIVNLWFIPYLVVSAIATFAWFRPSNAPIAAHRHTQVTRATHRELFDMLENLCISCGVSMPDFYIETDPSINAFTSGIHRKNYAIVVTSGLLEQCSPDEVECVLAHELTHIINRDTRLLSLTGLIGHMLLAAGNFLRFNIVMEENYLKDNLPIAHSVIPPELMPLTDAKDEADRQRIMAENDQRLKHWSKARFSGSEYDPKIQRDISMKRISPTGNFYLIFLGGLCTLGGLGTLFIRTFISQSREFIADAGAVELTKNPEALLSVLNKLQSASNQPITDALNQPLYFHQMDTNSLLAIDPPLHLRIQKIKALCRI